MRDLKSILATRSVSKDKYLTRDFQAFGLELAAKLADLKHKSLYIKMAKTTDRKILEEALGFVSDSRARNKAALFMWKVGQLQTANKTLRQDSGQANKVTAHTSRQE